MTIKTNLNPSPPNKLDPASRPPTEEEEEEEEEEKGRMRELVGSLSRMGFSEKQGRHAVKAVERR